MRVVTVGAIEAKQLIYGPYPPGGAGVPTVVYNADEVNTLYLSNTQEIDAGCITGSTTSDTDDLQVYIENSSDLWLQGTPLVVNVVSNASGVLGPTEFALPRNQCTLNVRNKNAATQTVGVEVVGVPY